MCMIRIVINKTVYYSGHFHFSNNFSMDGEFQFVYIRMLLFHITNKHKDALFSPAW